MKSNKTVLHYTVQDANISLLRYFLELNAFKSRDFVNSKVSQELPGRGLCASVWAEEVLRAPSCLQWEAASTWSHWGIFGVLQKPDTLFLYSFF